MPLRMLHFSAVIVLFSASVAFAADSIKTTSGMVTGKITETSPLKVTITTDGGPKEIPVNQIVVLYFDEEPSQLRTVKKNIAEERKYEDGVKTLERMKKENVELSKPFQIEAEYFTALAAAKMAIVGSVKIEDAYRSLEKWVNANPQSYHFLEGCEMLGQLAKSNRSYADAERYFSKQLIANWPDYRLKSLVAIGQMQLAQGKIGEAAKMFGEAIALPVEGTQAAAQKNIAQLGKAAILTAQDRPEEAIKMIEEVLPKCDPENAEVMGQAYLTLGNAYRKLSRSKEALFAYLKVDLLYPSVPEYHAEALFNLAELWQEMQKPDRAAKVKETLLQLYKNSPWAKKLDER